MAKVPVNKNKRVIPGGNKKKKMVIPGKTTVNKMKKTGVIPGKTRPKETVESADSKPFVLTDSNLISKVDEDSSFSRTMVEDVHVVEEVDDSIIDPTINYDAESVKQNIADMISDDSHLEFISDQVYAYRELSNVVDKGEWEPSQIIDLMDMFIRAINFNFVTIALIDSTSNDKFCGLVSRGNNSYPGVETISYLQQSIINGAINWDTLIELTSAKDSPFKSWVDSEEFECIALVPIHDGHKVLGFILSGSRTAYQPSDIASILLEMIGGRLGLSITSNSAYK